MKFSQFKIDKFVHSHIPFSKELGKVSITPKGDWNSSIANEKLEFGL